MNNKDLLNNFKKENCSKCGQPTNRKQTRLEKMIGTIWCKDCIYSYTVPFGGKTNDVGPK